VTTNDHHGPRLAPDIAFQYHAETSGQIAPCSSRIISHTATASPPRPVRKQSARDWQPGRRYLAVRSTARRGGDGVRPSAAACGGPVAECANPGTQQFDELASLAAKRGVV
jgi:hypothetical protein